MNKDENIIELARDLCGHYNSNGCCGDGSMCDGCCGHYDVAKRLSDKGKLEASEIANEIISRIEESIGFYETQVYLQNERLFIIPARDFESIIAELKRFSGLLEKINTDKQIEEVSENDRT